MQKVIKRLFYITISLFLLICLLPFMVIISIIIKLDSHGPIFFLQERPGFHRKIFKVYKFRTMKPGSENMIKGVEVTNEDDRVTRIGKILRRFKIDELPQLINILKGEMSLVGPRPERMEYLKEYSEKELHRFDMRPGLTGLAQVSGNIYISLEKRHELELEYINHFSLVLDIRILIRTIGVVLFGENKYKDNKIEV